MARRVVQLEGGTVDIGLQLAKIDEATHRLTTTEARLFAYLVRAAGRDVPRGELLTRVWGYADGTQTRTVDTTMRRLRAKVERDRAAPRHLVTVTGVGYRYEPLAEAAPVIPERRGNLRDDITSFVGRGDELAALQALWDDGARVVSVTGPAGVGKTRLARHHAAQRAAGGLQPGGAWLCDLSPCVSVSDFVAALAACLGVRIDDASIDRLALGLNRMGDALIVLDNFEQLTETASGALEALAAAASRARFLVTSRQRLRIAAESCFELAPLAGDDAVKLFTERAASQRHDLTPAPKLVHDVVDKLDRLPLAIELAAGRLNLLSIDALSKRLGDAVNLRATLDRSWELLTAVERAALSCCALFVGRFEVAAAEAVLGEGALALLQSLRDKSLLSIDAQGRLSMLHTIRAYARTKLEDDDAEQRHAHHYLAAHYAQDPDLSRLSRDAPNLEALISRWSERDPSTAARAAVCLDPLLFARGPHHVQRAMLARALRFAGDAGDVDAEVRTLVAIAESRAQAGDIDAAVDEAERALSIAGNESELRVAALTTRANIERRRGSAPDKANALYDDALSLAKASRLARWEARVLRHMASLNTERGELELARTRFEAALALYRDLGDRRAEATVLGNLGNVFLELVRDAEAATHHRMALETHRSLGDTRREAIVLSNLAVVDHQRGALEQSDEGWQTALAMHRDVANRRFEGFCLGGLAMVDFELGRIVDARNHTYQSLEVARETQDVRAEAIAHARWGALRAHAGDTNAAKAAFDEARATLGSRTPWWEAGVDVLQGFIALAEQDVAAANAKLALPPVRVASSFQRISQRILRAAINAR